ncbi:MAG TPA: nucleotide sugar dehydrogenase [Candidatus Limnocylindria bacterium]|nr:nucleotide sugar dehydrogenase [Candidatus Limnocylindria bacterium]
MTTVSIFGLGYVGSVSAACLAGEGVNVIGVDVSEIKRDLINSGRSPIVEEGLDELMAAGVASGRITATDDVERAVHDSDISFICVGTPSNLNGSLDLSAVERVAESIGLALASKPEQHTVVVRSTMLPGSTEERVIPALERTSGKRAGEGFQVCYNPEFLREGTSIKDFYHPPFTIIGADSEAAGADVARLYQGVEGETFSVPIRVAEMVKYVSNAYHALKVAFANEVGVLAQALDVDSHQVMDIFVKDRKLNVSPAYLRPGFAFGGSCLPKDLRALVHAARRVDVETPVLASILPSNERHVERTYGMVQAIGKRRIGLLGLSFKAGTDDLRESPLVTLVERLIGRGYDVRVFDRNVSLANLHGMNRAYIEREIPHIVSIMADSLDDVLGHADVLIIGNNDPAFEDVLDRRQPGQHVIDLVRVGTQQRDDPEYHGVAW